LTATDAPLPSLRDVPHHRDSIAIVGMAVNVPGARNSSELWELLMAGMDTNTEVMTLVSVLGLILNLIMITSQIPEHRFEVSAYSDLEFSKPGRSMEACRGNFIKNIDEFDNGFFRISPREARSMDPQQRLLLHTAYEALENAGYVPNATPSFQQATFSCYIGAATHDYVQNLRDDIDVHYSSGKINLFALFQHLAILNMFAGTLKAFLSGRISLVRFSLVY
jgi:acyl transferase domain-containing protein